MYNYNPYLRINSIFKYILLTLKRHSKQFILKLTRFNRNCSLSTYSVLVQKLELDLNVRSKLLEFLFLLLKHFLRLSLLGHVHLRLRRGRVKLQVVPVCVKFDSEMKTGFKTDFKSGFDFKTYVALGIETNSITYF